MIIDEQADFRTLLMHHVTTHWPDAIISAYDPAVAGHLPAEFSGAGNDLILLGSRHGDDRDGVEVLRQFKSRPGRSGRRRAAIAALHAVAPPELPRLRDVGIDVSVVLFTVSVTLLSSDMGKLYVAMAQALERLRVKTQS